MDRSNVDDYIKQGIYGQKETKPDERRKFLGTLRERIVIALTQGQLRENKIYPEVVDAFKANTQAHLFLNGHMNYEYLSRYIKEANKFEIEYTIVTNQEHNSEIGLVLAFDYAIDQEEIYVKKKVDIEPQQKPKGIASLFHKLFS
ncbi:YueI family protein [Cytobacillus spongiae]|jgi:uncharacterized protein YueI|uniref:YueI family protein n=1 Tax=Cytobacillus spongiae TaxID=2901381 RepID=UPI001F3F038F|nr:YueI family protein [Cytobacillus spongiae]UII56355.1 YueI family protein [Cytobacillus spongiae]